MNLRDQTMIYLQLIQHSNLTFQIQHVKYLFSKNKETYPDRVATVVVNSAAIYIGRPFLNNTTVFCNII